MMREHALLLGTIKRGDSLYNSSPRVISRVAITPFPFPGMSTTWYGLGGSRDSPVQLPKKKARSTANTATTGANSNLEEGFRG